MVILGIVGMYGCGRRIMVDGAKSGGDSFDV